MAARDDSVIRGSLIASLIFLVLSLALNFFFWRWGNTQSLEADSARDRLQNTQSELQTKDDQNRLMKAMLGVGGLTEAEFELLSQSSSGDPEMEQIEANFVKDMEYFGPEVDAQNRNYAKLPDFFVTAIRNLNETRVALIADELKARNTAKADVESAQALQQEAENARDDAARKLENELRLFTEDRNKMIQEKEQTRDQLVKLDDDFNKFRSQSAQKQTLLTRKKEELETTIDSQKHRINELTNDKYESTQGEIRFVQGGGRVVTINLGASDALRPGVTFGVIDRDETRLQDAKVKATIQITKIMGPHQALARVIARPAIATPIIEGDYVYSPFWAPGREVRIALAGEIDIDGDDRPDNEALMGMIKAAGAVVAANIPVTGEGIDTLDASIRFMVIGEEPDVSDDDRNRVAIETIGKAKARARELGLTVIPAWKLQEYLKTVDDTLTTPLGSAARAEDFPPTTPPGTNSRMPTDLPELYKRQTEGMQQGNTIVSP
tara:strand:- start:191258 stop:192742 length:1485 start_codon:yes stop_codon:yes gene_type:complete